MNSQEESAKLRQEFATCQKMFSALGDETYQLLISIMIMGPCSGMRIVDIAEQTSFISRSAPAQTLSIGLNGKGDSKGEGGTPDAAFATLVIP